MNDSDDTGGPPSPGAQRAAARRARELIRERIRTGTPMSEEDWRVVHQLTCATCEDGLPVNGQGERFCPDCGRQA